MSGAGAQSHCRAGKNARARLRRWRAQTGRPTAQHAARRQRRGLHMDGMHARHVQKSQTATRGLLPRRAHLPEARGVLPPSFAHTGKRIRGQRIAGRSFTLCSCGVRSCSLHSFYANRTIDCFSGLPPLAMWSFRAPIREAPVRKNDAPPALKNAGFGSCCFSHGGQRTKAKWRSSNRSCAAARAK